MGGRYYVYSLTFLAAFALTHDAPAGGQEKYRLKEIEAVGDSVKQDETLEMTVTINVTVNGQPALPVQLAVKEREVYVETLLAVGAKGRPTALRRSYAVSTKTVSNPGGMPKEEVSSLQDKTVTVRRVGNRVTVTVDKGRLSPEDHAEMMKALKRVQARFFPDRPLEIGESWFLSVPHPSEIFEGAKKATVSGRLVEVTQREGHRAAHLRVSVELAGRIPGAPLSIDAKLSGDIYHALDVQRPLAGDLSGPITVSGEAAQQGSTMRMTGRGTMSMKIRSQWLKVGTGAAAKH
jgi:hypothetical protein